MSTLPERIEVLKKHLEVVKKEYLDYIRDTSIPLEDRWKVFCDVPSDFRGHNSYCYDVEEIEKAGRDAIMYDGWLRHVEKYERVNLIDVVEYSSEYIREKEKFQKIDWNKVKEQLLRDNIGSYTYDW